MPDGIDLSQIPSRHQEMAFFERHRRQWSREHPRDWVAIIGDQIVARGPDLDAVMETARAAGHEHPFIGRLEDPALFDAAFIGPL